MSRPAEGDPDSLITFTKHEEEGAFTVDLVLRNLPPVDAFVVKWDWPLFKRAQELDPTKLKQAGGRPTKHKAEKLLKCLGDQRLRTGEWTVLAKKEHGISDSGFFRLLDQLEEAGQIHKSPIDEKWKKSRELPKLKTVKKINKDGATPKTVKTPKTRFWQSYSQNSQNIFSFGSSGSDLKIGPTRTPK